jgi:glycosyltransferase involved in cell wall biosynthesis/ribosomal protein S18 acetylase RimI-like enzyme
MEESRALKVAHLTTVDMSLRYLVMPQLLAVRDAGGEAVGISAPGPWVPELEAAGIRHIPLTSSTRGMDPLADLRAARELRHILRRERFDVLHTHNPKPGLYGRVLGRLSGVPIVVNTVHGLYATSDDRILKRVVVYGLEAVASRFSDAELVQSPEDMKTLRRWRVSPRSRTALLGNGVDLVRFDPGRFNAADRTRVRSSLGIADDHIVVGAVGRLVAEKGYPELFEAASRLDDRFVVLAIGPHDPDKSDALSDTVLTDATEAGVQLLGMRDDVDELYAAMDMFILPSHREGFPRAAMEAAASGLPIIATDIRGCRQVVDPDRNGVLIPVRDPDAIAAAITRLGDDAGLRRRMAEAGRRKAEEEFDEGRVVATVMATYRDVARRKGLHLDVADPSGVTFRPAEPGDAPTLAGLHRDSITGGFLPTLGHRFLSRLYTALIDWPGSEIVVASTPRGSIGFVAGVTDTGIFYRHFAKRHGMRAAIAAGYHLVRPSAIRGAIETLRYDGGEVDVDAELMSMAVAADGRGAGLGSGLGTRFLERMTLRGVAEIRVVVGADNAIAIGLYRKLGFVDAATIEVHAGTRSQLLIWQA